MSATLEAGLKPPDHDALSERAEIHQAEEPRLIWSDEQGGWVPTSQAVEDDAQHTIACPASDEEQSQVSSTKTLQEGRKPVRAFSEGSNGAIYINFEDDDPENPFEWSKRRKWIITGIGAWLTTLVAISGPGLASGIPAMQEELGISHFLGSLAFGAYPLGFGVGAGLIVLWFGPPLMRFQPLVLAPLSEVYGRNPMYLCSMVIFTILYLPLALSDSIAVIIVFRFLSGVSGSVGSTMVGGTIADIWVAKERGKPMGVFSIGAFAGTGLGPMMFGFVVQEIGWRWINWIQMIMAGVTAVVVIVYFRETRGNVILSKRAAKLRKETGDERYQCRADQERASLAILVKTGVSRPLWFLISEPIVLSLSVWVGFAWGCMYGLVSSIMLVYRNIYGWSLGITGLAFTSIFLGALCGWALNFVQERAYQKYHPTKGIEARLCGSMVAGLAFAVGSMIYAWANKGHWIGPLIGVTILITGIYTIYQGVFTYLADAYTIYASSAMSAQSFARNFMGFVFPLFTTQMYNNLGYSWAGFLFAVIGFALSIIPFVLFRYGKRIRARSPAAIALAKQLEEAEARRAARLAEREKAGLPPTADLAQPVKAQ